MTDKKIVKYHIEVDGPKVTMVIITDSAESASRLADTLNARFTSGTVSGVPPIDPPDAA